MSSVYMWVRGVATDIVMVIDNENTIKEHNGSLLCEKD